MSIQEIILKSSEVWGLLIPLLYIIVKRPRNKAYQPLIWYVVIAFILNTIATVSWFFVHQMPAFLQNNNIFYNLHSIARVVFLTWFLANITNAKLKRVCKWVLGTWLVLVAVNFIFFESILFLSTRLLISQSIILLLLYIADLLRSLQSNSQTNWIKEASFLVRVGVLLYEASTFFVWLFVVELAAINPKFGLFSLDLYKVFYVVFCLFLAAALQKAENHNNNKFRLAT